VIKYIGSKRLLVPHIVELVRSLAGVRTVLDAFSGTARVGHALKRAGYDVTANDHTAYAYALGRCYVGADARRVRRDAERIVRELGRVAPRAGYFTDTFCVRSRYLQPKNGARVDAIRAEIARLALEPDLEAVVLVSLMEAADRVDSTCGLQMAYLKQWAARSYRDLELRVPDVLDGPGRALGVEARDAIAAGEWDAIYLDPPYNQHKYLGNYHVWETLVRGDAPAVYGTACKRIDCKTYKSAFNSKPDIAPALREVVRAARARYLVVSFSDEGYLSPDEVIAILADKGEVESHAVDYKRYVGAQIGIYNPAGEKVGKVSHLRNREHLFVVRCRDAGRRAGRARVAASGQTGTY